MSTIARSNFTPNSDVTSLWVKQYTLADPTLLNPTNSLTLVDGEWMSINAAGLAVRASSVAGAGNLATTISFPMWAETGRYDTQALSSKGVPLVFLNQSEWDTRIFDAASVTGGAAITTSLQPLVVCSLTINSLGGGNRVVCGLVGSSYTSNNIVVGYVSRLSTINGGKLRFISGWAVRNGTT